jgi:hypothetical protein
LDKPIAIAALAVLFAAGGGLAGLPLSGLVTLVLALVCVADRADAAAAARL